MLYVTFASYICWKKEDFVHLCVQVTCTIVDPLIYYVMSGDNASIDELVEVIVAAQITKNIEKEKDDISIICTKVLIFDSFEEIFNCYHGVISILPKVLKRKLMILPYFTQKVESSYVIFWRVFSTVIMLWQS